MALQVEQSSVCIEPCQAMQEEQKNCVVAQVSDQLQVQSWQVLIHKSTVEQRWMQQQLVVVLLNGRSKLHVSEPFLLCAVPFLVCLLLQMDLMSRLPACDPSCDDLTLLVPSKELLQTSMSACRLS